MPKTTEASPSTMRILKPILATLLLFFGLMPAAAVATPMTFGVCANSFTGYDFGADRPHHYVTFAEYWATGDALDYCEEGIAGSVTFDPNTGAFIDEDLIVNTFVLLDLFDPSVLEITIEIEDGDSVINILAGDPGGAGAALRLTVFEGHCTATGIFAYCLESGIEYGDFDDPSSFRTLFDYGANGFANDFNVILGGLIAPSAVPLPAGGVLLLAGLGALGVARRRRTRAKA